MIFFTDKLQLLYTLQTSLGMDTKIMIGVLVALIIIVMVYMRMKKKSAGGSGSDSPLVTR
mgnify:CR=1 FL=1